MSDFDWKNPDYSAALVERSERLAKIRAQPELLPELKAFYAQDPAQFINDYGLTFDPRQSARGLAVEVPFLLFPRQREMIAFILERMRTGEPGLIEKSRDMGASWLLMALASTLCLFQRNTVVGIGSSKEDRVDKLGDPSSLLWKARFFVKNLPAEFRGSWDETRDSAHLRLRFPDTGSALVGEAGDQIGRGGRSTLYLIDEAAFLERPQLAEMSLASNTNTRIDVSTPCGRGNAFAVKRFGGKVPVFRFHWTQDPRKDERWYQRQTELLDPVTLAQEVDLSYDASVEGILIPAEWVHAAIGAHTKLGLEVTGARRAALDVADEGRDRNALVGRHGILLEYASSWSGKGSNIYATTVRAINACDKHHYPVFDFDSDGLGAGVRGDAVQINEKRREAGKREIEAEAFRGSGAVFDPDGSLVEGRQNKDYFANLKAQSWWALRLRFQATYRAVVEGLSYRADDLISIDPALPDLQTLLAELSQPTYSINAVGKIVIDKAPEGAASPNLADAVMIAFSPFQQHAYFGTRSSAAVAVPASRQMPTAGFDRVFAVVSFVGDAAAVVYIAANYLDPTTGQPRVPGRGCESWILDWELRELGLAADAWIGEIAARAEELQRSVMRITFRAAPVLCDDFDEGWAAVLRQRGFPAKPVGKDLPPVAERFAKAKPYFRVGGLVKHADAAERRVVSFRGSSARNHLREVASSTEPTESNPLAIAYATAILTVYWGRRVVPQPLAGQPLGGVEVLQPALPPGPWRGFRV